MNHLTKTKTRLNDWWLENIKCFEITLRNIGKIKYKDWLDNYNYHENNDTTSKCDVQSDMNVNTISNIILICKIKKYHSTIIEKNIINL